MTTLEPEQKDILEKPNEIALEATWGTVERVNGVPKAIAVIQEAMEEIKRLREEKSDLRLYEIQMKNGEIDMAVGSEDCNAFFFSLIQIFKQNDAKNFFTTTVEVADEHGERYALTIQKVGGETPAEQLSQMRQETAKEILNELKFLYAERAKEYTNWDTNKVKAVTIDWLNADIAELAQEYGVTLEEKNS